MPLAPREERESNFADVAPSDGQEHLFGEEMFAGDIEALCNWEVEPRHAAYHRIAEGTRLDQTDDD